MQRFLHLRRCTRKLDHRSAFGHLPNLKAVRLQPRCDGLNILIRRAELPPELLRRKPFVVVGRSFVLLVIQQLSQRRFLLVTALQDQQHALHGQIRRSHSAIELCARQWVCIALESGQLRVVDSLDDQGPHIIFLR